MIFTQGYYPGANAYNNQYYGQQPNNMIMVVLVDGEASMRAYPVGAGNTVMLMDFNGGHFWLKSTDTNGMPQQLRTFDFKELSPQVSQPTQAVTREEFAALSEKFDKLLEELGGK